MYAYRESGVWVETGSEEGRARDRALTELYVDHYDSLRRTAYVILGDGALAEEIVMEAFAKSLSKWQLVSRADHRPAYLRQIVINLCRSKIRRKVLERRVGRGIKAEAEAELRLPKEESGADVDVWRAVRELPARQRACIVLRYLDDLSEPEIAQALDCPVGTVKSQLSRARGKLAELLGPEVEIEEPS